MKTNVPARKVAAAVVIVATWALPVAAHGPEGAAARRQLDALVDRAIDEGGPFFTKHERALIERACGYSPGSWNGFQVNMVGDVFHCTNGRRVSSPEIRSVMAAAAPRIDAYVDAVMERPEIVAAMERVARLEEAEEMRRR